MSTQFTVYNLLRGILPPTGSDGSRLWSDWDGDVPRLIDQLLNACSELFTSPALTQLPSDAAVRRRTLFCLDRLIPLDQSDMLVPLLGPPIIKALGLSFKTTTSPLPYALPRALYAWARRVPPSERGQIIAALSANTAALLADGAHDTEGFLRWRETEARLEWLAENSWACSAEFAGTAWAEACPADQSTSLLEGPLLLDRDPVLFEYGGFGLHTLVRELVKKMPELAMRLAVMVPFMRDHLSRLSYSPIDFCSSVAEQIIVDLASVCPTHKDVLPETERWAWFQAHLQERGFAEAADVLDSLVSMEESYLRTDAYKWPVTFWIRGHGKSSWEPVYERLSELEAAYPYSVVGHADALIPDGRLDLWEPILSLEHRGLYPLNAFCRWLPPEYRDVLLEWDIATDQDAACCAYYAYLHRTPRPVLEWLWERRGSLPEWRVEILDRFLFAPPTLKPEAMFYDTQTVEDDFRLSDPLNWRSI